MVSVLPTGVIEMLLPADSVTAPVRPFRVVTPELVGAAVVCFVPSGKTTPLPTPLTFASPTTSSFAVGAEVPIPTFALFPRTTELLCETTALAPMAVAFVIPSTPAFVPEPIKVVFWRVLGPYPLSEPKNELPPPLVI